MRKLTVLLFGLLALKICFAYEDVKLYQPGAVLEYDTIPYMVDDKYFDMAYGEMVEMFEGKREYNFKRAEFLVEWAYGGGKLDYGAFCHTIDSIASILNKFIDDNNYRQYRTCANYAVYSYLVEPSYLNGYKKLEYDFDDPLAKKDFSKMFVSNLIKTRVGQCMSMTMLYKVLCDELGGRSFFAFAPHHIYIKHVGEDGKWINVELTHGGVVRDIWLIETTDISTEAIRNGIFLTALSEKENIALMMMLLAKAYWQKYDSWDYFAIRCAEKVLAQLPNFSDALIVKFNVMRSQGQSYVRKFGYFDTPYSNRHLAEFIDLMDKIDYLGYSQQTQEEYDERVREAMQKMEEKIKSGK